MQATSRRKPVSWKEQEFHFECAEFLHHEAPRDVRCLAQRNGLDQE